MNAAAATLNLIETYSRPREICQTPAAALTIFQRLNKGDRTAFEDCIRIYGNYVWQFASDHMYTVTESSTLAGEIFQDIWEYGEQYGNTPEPEDLLIKKIAVRRLYKHKWDGLRHRAAPTSELNILFQ